MAARADDAPAYLLAAHRAPTLVRCATIQAARRTARRVILGSVGYLDREPIAWVTILHENTGEPVVRYVRTEDDRVKIA